MQKKTYTILPFAQYTIRFHAIDFVSFYLHYRIVHLERNVCAVGIKIGDVC